MCVCVCSSYIQTKAKRFPGVVREAQGFVRLEWEDAEEEGFTRRGGVIPEGGSRSL